MKKIFVSTLLLIFSIGVFAQKSQKNNADSAALRIFTAVDQMPEFQGGQSALMQYLSSNIRYPSQAKEDGVEGRVVVQFVVCTDGSLCDEKIVRSVNPSMDMEVLRVVKAMPNWKPARQNGQAVKTYFTLPVTFKLQGQARDSTLPDAREYLLEKPKTVEEQQSEDKIYTSVEYIPEFPGGMVALQNFLAMNIRYPTTAYENNKQGKVILRFVVDIDGSISNIEVQINPGGGLAEEAIRVVKAMPKWKPGKMGSKPVKVYYTLPVTFKLAK